VGLGVLLCTGLLALAVILGEVPGLREQALGILPGVGATPSATLALGDRLFYLLPNPPGVEVTLDGRTLAHLPFSGNPAPLRLSVGTHVFTWRSHVYPFLPLQCRVSVPRAAADTCPAVRRGLLPRDLANLPGTVIGMHVSLSAVAPAAGGVARLTKAIQDGLDTRRSTALVQPGEHYLSYPGGRPSVVVATQPLRATLSYQLVSPAGYPEPCNLAQPAIRCRFPGQDCGQLCTVAQPPSGVSGADGAWIVAATVSAVWEYRTLDGRVVAPQVREEFGLQLAVMRVMYDGAGWHVTPILGHSPALDATDDAACDPARYAIVRTPSWKFMLDNPPPGAMAQFASGDTPADGCVAVLTHGQQAVFLQRFGVLLTVNDAARNPVDNLPMADAAEQRVAQHLLALLSP
ncbi:MAG TPA: hypothetical protein VE258_16695, partial [Ktedonobacterales bacterium]|nr:hypothetical protein [Ktedonobacterales bacterium]